MNTKFPKIFFMASMIGLSINALADDTQIPQQIVQEPSFMLEKKPLIGESPPSLEVGKTRIFSGKLEKVNWQKSGESYCQGGSEYYVLVVKKQRYTLESLRDPQYDQDPEAFQALQERLAKWVGRTVTLKGQEVVRYISEKEHCPDPTMQCMAGNITCSWVRIVKIISPKEK